MDRHACVQAVMHAGLYAYIYVQTDNASCSPSSVVHLQQIYLQEKVRGWQLQLAAMKAISITNKWITRKQTKSRRTTAKQGSRPDAII